MMDQKKFSVRKRILDHNSEYCGHRLNIYHKSNTQIIQTNNLIINQDDFKISFKRFSENNYVEFSDSHTSASTGRGDFNNPTNVTPTQIQSDDNDIIYALILALVAD